MKSPFPGMDPYLEKHWRDVHHNLITFAQGELNPQLPGDLRVRVEERIFVESVEGNGRSMYPDIRVVERGKGKETAASPQTGLAVAEPLLIHLPEEEISQGFLEIIDVESGNRVITVLEVLSLANKTPGEGQDQYLQKQRELKEGGVSLVEIDLLRAGKRVLVVPPEMIPPSHRTIYQICVRKGWRPSIPEVYRVALREPLPTIKIPLRETDPEVHLDLQKLIERCYENGRYDDIDYTVDLEPPLEPEDALWADELLRKNGKR
jgi:hypothetical protein